MSQWIRVTRQRPCPICGKPNWCGITPDGEVVRCMRVESDKESKGGWIHVLGDDRKITALPKPQKERRTPPEEMPTLAIKYHEEARDVPYLAKELGVTTGSLERLDIGWCGYAYTFPMRNENEVVTGIATRMKNGTKRSISGSVLGLYWPRGVEVSSDTILWLPEGASDCAALLDLGLDAIGRFSCRTNSEILAGLLRKKKRRVVLVADNDEPKERPDGSVYFPGYEGAKDLARYLKRYTYWVKVIKPRFYKDVREWKQNGMTRRMLYDYLDNTAIE